MTPYYEHAMRRATLQARSDVWQPIETAPKDQAVVLWVPRRYPHVVIGEHWAHSDELTWGWWTQSSRVEPTHWMPLPLPPTS
jgi:hypothetical protein